jgi:glutathione synthase/RimK-type ligase-like ATP-grasp enzyme
MNKFHEMIKKIGEELDINVTLLSDNWMIVLEKDNETHFIQGYKFDLNNHGIGNILDDKGMFKELLSYKGLPTVEGISFYQVYDEKIVLDYLNKYQKIIVKGNNGTCGKNVYLVDNKEDLFNKCDYLLSKQDSISIEPYYDIKNEYRVIILNNEVKVVYGKERPTIIGDGIHSIKELAIMFNDYFKSKTIKNSDYIPKNGEKVELDFRFNLSNGARLFANIDNDLKNKIIDIALLVSKEINITFASIDIIYTNDNQLLVLEANSGVMMDNFINQYPNGEEIAYNIYKEAIKLMFKLDK